MPSRRIAVRRSSIHGRGVFALQDIAAGTRLIEYRGEVIPWDVAHERYNTRPDAANGTTYFFDLGNGLVIDGGSDGNSARFVNHGCRPNCEAIDEDGRIWFFALTDIAEGEELLLDYSLEFDDGDAEDEHDDYPCSCGAPDCRKTMLAA